MPLTQEQTGSKTHRQAATSEEDLTAVVRLRLQRHSSASSEMKRFGRPAPGKEGEEKGTYRAASIRGRPRTDVSARQLPDLCPAWIKATA